MQSAEIRFLRRVHGVTKERNFEIREVLKVEPLFRIERSQLRWFGHVTRMSHERLARQVVLATTQGMRPRGRARTGWCDSIYKISLLCIATHENPLERMLKSERRSTFGASIPTWPSSPRYAFLKRCCRSSKYDPVVDEVELVHPTSDYAQMRFRLVVKPLCFYKTLYQ